MRFPFSEHIGLLEQFLANRQAIAGELERQLFSARGKAIAQSGDRESIAEILNACFFESSTIPRHRLPLQGLLEAAHLAEGFEPVRHDGYSRDLDPVELVLRACYYWDSTRWPGTKGRLAYAQSVYAVFIVRQLERLSLRIWDDESPNHDQPSQRLRQVQRLLDTLNATGQAVHEIRLVRDARWLIQTAQGPLTRHVKPYFTKADNVSALPTDIGLEVHKAGVVLAGGHLRSQLRHLSSRTGGTFDDPQLIALTRSSNSMDVALLVRDLIPLLEAYSLACDGQDSSARGVLADAILQGLSADPELLLTRLDLLVPSTMIEDLFVDRSGAGAARYTTQGEGHLEGLNRYAELIGRTAHSLRQDCSDFDPAGAAYSPLGIVYGFCADLLANMVLNTLRTGSSPDRSLEDLFNSRDALDEKRAQAEEWERLPKRAGEPTAFEHSTLWAAQMHTRLTAALDARAARPTELNASAFRKAYLHVVPRGGSLDAPPAEIISAQEHCLSSDLTWARLTGATVVSTDRMIADRAEGRFLACVDSDTGWLSVSKVPLTVCLSQGKDGLIVDVPAALIDVLRMTCPDLVVLTGRVS